jgi:hypothetical protein
VDDPRYLERGPFSYTDAGLVEQDLRSAGFETVELETVELSSTVRARDAARGIVLGSPFRAEIERLDTSGSRTRDNRGRASSASVGRDERADVCPPRTAIR